MIEFLLGFLMGLFAPESVGKFCCGCLILLFGGGFALMSIIFALAAEDQEAGTRFIAGLVGAGLGWLTYYLIKKIQ